MSRTFWNSCPKSLEYFPKTACNLGAKTLESENATRRCSWAINSAQDHYCFWKWLRRVSNEDGQFEALHQHQISTLLKVSTAKTPVLLREAFEKLKKLETFQELEDLIE